MKPLRTITMRKLPKRCLPVPGRLSIIPTSFLLLLVSFPFLRGSTIPEEVKSASHRWMIEELRKIEEATPSTNMFLGTETLEGLRERWKLIESNQDAPLSDRFRILMWLGIAEMNHGLERDSITHMEKALSLTVGQSIPPDAEREIFDANRMLAIAYLRLAETENCCASPNPESCVLPLHRSALHDRREGSEKAIHHLNRWLEDESLDSDSKNEAIWLLNLAYMTLGEHPQGVPEQWRLLLPSESPPGPRTNPRDSPSRFPEFQNIAERSGVDTFGLSGGAIADDFDGDGRIDIVISSWDTSVSLRFFRNEGDGSFEEKDANFEGIKGGLNLVQTDFDNDGDRDIFVMRGAWLGENGRHPNSLLENDGAGRFLDVTHTTGLAESAYPTQSAAWADYDLDGDLDLFVGNESSQSIDAPCQLFRNDDGKFTDVAATAGLGISTYAKGVSWGDFDGDCWPDLIISSLESENYLFRNRGDGTFDDVSSVLHPAPGPVRSFAAWFFDYDGDGWQDIFFGGYSGTASEFLTYYRTGKVPAYTHAGLFRNEQGKRFVDCTVEARLSRPMLPMGSNFGDLTGNGHPDIYLGTGTPDFDIIVPNTLYINDRGRFSDQTLSSRMGHLQKGHGVALADFDEDGDLDVFEQMGGALPGDAFYDVLFENPGFGRHWVAIELEGVVSNRPGIGCRVSLLVDEPETGKRWIRQWMSSGGSFGANPFRLHFGLGEAKAIEQLQIHWPVTGKTQTIPAPGIDQLLRIREEP